MRKSFLLTCSLMIAAFGLLVPALASAQTPDTTTYRLTGARIAIAQDVRIERDANGKPTRTINHMLKMFLIDPEGMIREIYSLAYLQQPVMLNDIRTLALEEQPTAVRNR